MADEKPVWVEQLVGELAGAIESFGLIDYRYSPASRNPLGMAMVEIAPVLMEIDTAGPEDGDEIFDPWNNFDLLAVQKAFERVDTLSFGYERGSGYCLRVQGKIGPRQVIVRAFVEPFADATLAGSVYL